MYLIIIFGHLYDLQQEAKFERQEDRLHNKAARAALHGNIGRAVQLEVSLSLSLSFSLDLSIDLSLS